MKAKLLTRIERLKSAVIIAKRLEENWWTDKDLSDWIDQEIQEVRGLVNLTYQQGCTEEQVGHVEKELQERFLSFMKINNRLEGGVFY